MLSSELPAFQIFYNVLLWTYAACNHGFEKACSVLSVGALGRVAFRGGGCKDLQPQLANSSLYYDP